MLRPLAWMVSQSLFFKGVGILSKWISSKCWRNFIIHGGWEFDCHLNNTFIALILRKNDALEVKDYRPISLLHSVYKIVSKVFTSRLKVVMKDIISDPQGAFVAGRQILNAVLIVNECVDDCLKAGMNGILIKLDMEKANEYINLMFLDYMLDRIGFERKWRI